MKNKSDRKKTEKNPLEQPEKTNTQAIEQGGRGGLDPTRYGDWEIKGKCVDF